MAATIASFFSMVSSIGLEVRVGNGIADNAKPSDGFVELSESLARQFGYNLHFKQAGDWRPPTPPPKEISHLHGRDFIPPPRVPSRVKSETLMDENNHDAHGTPRRRRLLQSDSATGLKPQKVPHNWFGSGSYLAPKFAIATGKEECEVCYAMIDASEKSIGGVTLSPALVGGEASAASPQGPAIAGNIDLCSSMDVSYKAMCKGYANYLQQCPSFVHNICHEDLGGSERLRAPCPNYLKCYYCLRINPLYCLDIK